MTDKNKVSAEVYVGIANGGYNKSVERIADIVCSVYKIDVNDLKISTRKRPVPDARKTFCDLARRYNDDANTLSLANFLNRDHSTVVAATKSSHELYSYNPYFKRQMDKCEKIVRGGFPISKHEEDNYKQCIGYWYGKTDKLKDLF